MTHTGREREREMNRFIDFLISFGLIWMVIILAASLFVGAPWFLYSHYSIPVQVTVLGGVVIVGTAMVAWWSSE